MRCIIHCYQTVNNTEQLMMIYTPDDILIAKEEGKTGFIIGAQSCEFVNHNDLYSSVEIFQRIGLRIMQLGYNHRTFAADGCFSGVDAGLSNDGKILIYAMERYGVTVDLSHAGFRSTLDAMEVCSKPPIFSHSNPKALFDHPRNINEEQIKKCAALGGVIGVSSYNVTLWDANANAGGCMRRDSAYFSNLVLRTPGYENSLPYKSYEAGRGYLSVCVDGIESMANMEMRYTRGHFINFIIYWIGDR